jgi:hypothetical protein
VIDAMPIHPMHRGKSGFAFGGNLGELAGILNVGKFRKDRQEIRLVVHEILAPPHHPDRHRSSDHSRDAEGVKRN